MMDLDLQLSNLGKLLAATLVDTLTTVKATLQVSQQLHSF